LRRESFKLSNFSDAHFQLWEKLLRKKLRIAETYSGAKYLKLSAVFGAKIKPAPGK